MSQNLKIEFAGRWIVIPPAMADKLSRVGYPLRTLDYVDPAKLEPTSFPPGEATTLAQAANQQSVIVIPESLV